MLQHDLLTLLIKKEKKDKAFSLESLLVLIFPPPHVSFKGIKL